MIFQIFGSRRGCFQLDQITSNKCLQSTDTSDQNVCDLIDVMTMSGVGESSQQCLVRIYFPPHIICHIMECGAWLEYSFLNKLSHQPSKRLNQMKIILKSRATMMRGAKVPSNHLLSLPPPSPSSSPLPPPASSASCPPSLRAASAAVSLIR